MTFSRKPFFAVLCLAALSGAAPAGDQPGPDGTVTGVGVVELKKQPDVLRVQIELLAKGKDLKEALARLKDRREAVKVRLAAFNAAPESIAFGDPSLGPDKTQQQKQFEAMVAQQMRNKGGKPAPKTKEAPPAVVATVLRFDVPLKAANAEELLLVADALQQKIKEADLSGMKEFEKLSPQEEELAEEAQIFAQRGGGGEEPKSGEPAFLFVCKIPDQEVSRVRTEAFQKARQEAMDLTRAAGAILGSLRRLESHNSGSPDDAPGGYGSYYGRNPQARFLQPPADAQRAEAIGLQPGLVTYRVAITASFALKSASP